jgi:hypothetical protein
MTSMLNPGGSFNLSSGRSFCARGAVTSSDTITASTPENIHERLRTMIIDDSTDKNAPIPGHSRSIVPMGAAGMSAAGIDSPAENVYQG